MSALGLGVGALGDCSFLDEEHDVVGGGGAGALGVGVVVGGVVWGVASRPWGNEGHGLRDGGRPMLAGIEGKASLEFGGIERNEGDRPRILEGGEGREGTVSSEGCRGRKGRKGGNTPCIRPCRR